ncbi:hypothetical protein STSP2_00483 [Anaerohalosphaera lusitana]|uniref:Uncharacterized protein n=1 Tax=Anaerohalosphaera lusitana TaxID=1936003 RepID=A0A1U9NHF4_9BACT|nr:hypothetical protein [Anaerohalosphaera lusitana]AQT67339.1 hypothetical protein STSP2_00483 [Anaerohalosphaera lusitana]
MTQNKKLPLSLRIVAALFILTGISGILEMIIGLFQDEFILNIGGILALLTGLGLLKLSSGWRSFALFVLWFYMIGIPAMLVFCAISDNDKMQIFNKEIVNPPLLYDLAFMVPLFLIVLWMYHILTRPNVRKLFIPSEQTTKLQSDPTLFDGLS